jgi:hypothetical protein
MQTVKAKTAAAGDAGVVANKRERIYGTPHGARDAVPPRVMRAAAGGGEEAPTLLRIT